MRQTQSCAPKHNLLSYLSSFLVVPSGTNRHAKVTQVTNIAYPDFQVCFCAYLRSPELPNLGADGSAEYQKAGHRTPKANLLQRSCCPARFGRRDQGRAVYWFPSHSSADQGPSPGSDAAAAAAIRIPTRNAPTTQVMGAAPRKEVRGSESFRPAEVPPAGHRCPAGAVSSTTLRLSADLGGVTEALVAVRWDGAWHSRLGSREQSPNLAVAFPGGCLGVTAPRR